MLIKNIFVELRSRLRSCNVYITTTIDLTKNCTLKINLQSNSIILNYYPNSESHSYDITRKDSVSSIESIESLSDCYSEDDTDIIEVIPISEFCHIIPNSMSGLKIDKYNISFRILTEPKNGGNFYQELLAANKQITTKTIGNAPKLNLNAGEEIKIVCANCLNVVSENVIKFDRILELPTENLDMSDWFCHNHGHSSHDHEVVTLKSNKYDLLYRLTYFLVNFCVLSDKCNKFNAKRNVYHCNRCLAWLGSKVKDDVKLFNSTIKIVQQGIENHIFGYQDSNDVSLNDFIYTIESMSKEFNIGFQYAIMCKIVLECNISATKKQYLLIWIMDKELQVLKNAEDYVETENEDKIKLVSSFLTKILFKVEMCLSDEVQVWLSDPSIVSSEISKSMFKSGVDHLRKMSLKVPESFRTTNGYSVSYLKV